MEGKYKDPEFEHYTVMAHEAVDALNCVPGKIYVDATLGGGGHSELILKKIQPDGQLIAFDIDDDAIASSKKRLKDYKNLTIVKESYSNIKKVLQNLGIKEITGGIVFDLGASYHQLTKQERGFSFMKDAPLDMRFDRDSDVSAYDIVNGYSEDDLIKIISEYGEEKFTKRIVKNIINYRQSKNIETTGELAQIIKNAVPKTKEKIHPATRTFQAIRIEVNQELQNIKNTLNEVLTLLSVDAIISVISFHSLEDRLVKQCFKYYASKCRCKPTDPVCHCKPPMLELINKKPITATELETKENPPSRSAKLRVAKKISSWEN
ncbi:MAG: 16S rRNA (cytosine(1402)-N(4))-methyltransferase RsmH [Candidatus Gastranaerophilaceae bacterium]|jgi:S-adenosyl-methyltransferase mraW|uniref:Ribosomal RNA small subunit methyltransferase H n=1 Tax=Candidatus Limenecus avicola TaxID=2840847 RepID=A0A9D1MZK8_9CLOT|nr:16S rRNA (cytosine(1402)-N(4))-methyltransferase RsmH [Candidatus Limenecus avicola]